MFIRPSDPSAARLSERQHEVLTQIIAHHVETGHPVASRYLARLSSEGLSAASIRSIMAELEEAGFLAHPHTSSGRVPTGLGYSYYVKTMGKRQSLTDVERQSLSTNLFAVGGIDSLIARCCRLLSVVSSMVAVGTAPDHSATTYRHVELIRINERRVLVTFIAASGLVRQQVIEVEADETQAQLSRCAGFLNEELSGRSLLGVREHLLDSMRRERAIYDVLARRALHLGARYFLSEEGAEGELYVGGADRLLDRPPTPEDFDRLKSLHSALEEKRHLVKLLNSCLRCDGVTTAIGSETDAPELVGCSLVAANYGCGQERVGTIGLIGPTRMDYDRAMALVEYVAELLGGALARSRQ